MLTIVIPAFNEEDGIGSVLESLTASGNDYEIIVVDDGSQDGTADKARACKGVRVIQHRRNRGYGAAIKSGMQHASNDLICITDADGTYPNECIPEMLALLQRDGCDMVVGVRTRANVAIPLIRRPAKWFIKKLAEFVSGDSIADVNSGLRIFRREMAFRLLDILPDGFSFTTTITLGMLANGYFVQDFPIDYRARVGRSKIRPIHDTLNFIQLVLRMALYFAPLKIFLPLSGICLLVALIWGLVSMCVFGQLADVSTLVIVMTGVQVAVIGMLAELINRRLPNRFRDET